MGVFATSDLHLGHPHVAVKRRGFSTVEEHDATIIRNLKRRVKAGDTCYFLGDTALGGWPETIQQLKDLECYKVLVAGNHDRCHPMHSNAHTFQRAYLEVFDAVVTSATIRHDGNEMLMSHFPYDGEGATRPDDKDRYTQWRLRDEGATLIHGHVHDTVTGRLSAKGTPMVHVGVDAWNLFPVSLHDITQVAQQLRPAA